MSSKWKKLKSKDDDSDSSSNSSSSSSSSSSGSDDSRKRKRVVKNARDEVRDKRRHNESPSKDSRDSKALRDTILNKEKGVVSSGEINFIDQNNTATVQRHNEKASEIPETRAALQKQDIAKTTTTTGKHQDESTDSEDFSPLKKASLFRPIGSANNDRGKREERDKKENPPIKIKSPLLYRQSTASRSPPPNRNPLAESRDRKESMSPPPKENSSFKRNNDGDENKSKFSTSSDRDNRRVSRSKSPRKSSRSPETRKNKRDRSDSRSRRRRSRSRSRSRDRSHRRRHSSRSSSRTRNSGSRRDARRSRRSRSRSHRSTDRFSVYRPGPTWVNYPNARRPPPPRRSFDRFRVLNARRPLRDRRSRSRGRRNSNRERSRSRSLRRSVSNDRGTKGIGGGANIGNKSISRSPSPIPISDTGKMISSNLKTTSMDSSVLQQPQLVSRVSRGHSASSSLSTSADGSSTSSGGSSSDDSERKKKSRKKKKAKQHGSKSGKKHKKEKKKKHKKKHKKVKKRSKDKVQSSKKSKSVESNGDVGVSTSLFESKGNNNDVSNNSAEVNKIHVDTDTIKEDKHLAKKFAPMTKEEYEKRQSVIRKELDPETGRYRLIKGDGEILEEIVSKKQHMEINKHATKMDGEYFKSTLSAKLSK